MREIGIFTNANQSDDLIARLEKGLQEVLNDLR